LARIRRAKIAAPSWTAEFETDGCVRTADARISYMRGWSDEKVRDYVKSKGWKASRVMTVLEKAEEDPFVQAVMRVFPGAEVVDVRRR
jgi:hypothetical protein